MKLKTKIMEKETRKLIGNLADAVANRSDKLMDERFKKIDELMKDCERNKVSTEEAIDILYKSGLYLGTREELEECFVDQ